MSEAKKDRAGKPDLSLIPYCVEAELARAMMNGEQKYGRYNYCNGHKFSELVAASKRHLGKFFEGEDRAPDSGVHHLAHVMANCLMMIHQIELGTATDDRYKSPRSTEALTEAPTQFVPEESIPPGRWYEIVVYMKYGRKPLVLEAHSDPLVAVKRLEIFKKGWPGHNLEVRLVDGPAQSA